MTFNTVVMLYDRATHYLEVLAENNFHPQKILCKSANTVFKLIVLIVLGREQPRHGHRQEVEVNLT